MTRSLDCPGPALGRSHSYTAGTGGHEAGSPHHRALHRTPSTRRKPGLPALETFSESTESESTEEGGRQEVTTPGPVDISGGSDCEEMCGEISSSSEIEIGEEEEVAGQAAVQEELPSPDTEHELTIRSDVSSATMVPGR